MFIYVDTYTCIHILRINFLITTLETLEISVHNITDCDQDQGTTRNVFAKTKVIS